MLAIAEIHENTLTGMMAEANKQAKHTVDQLFVQACDQPRLETKGRASWIKKYAEGNRNQN
jgi:hypothetical protein